MTAPSMTREQIEEVREAFGTPTQWGLTIHTLCDMALRALPEPGGEPDWPECYEFYNSMQAYRHADLLDQKSVVAAYESVKQWIREQVTGLLAANAELRERCKRAELERDQQERFKWSANERAESAESQLAACREAREKDDTLIDNLLAGWDGMDSIDYMDDEYAPALEKMEQAVAEARAARAGRA